MTLLLFFLLLLPVHFSVPLAFNIAKGDCSKQSFGIALTSIDLTDTVISSYILSRERGTKIC